MIRLVCLWVNNMQPSWAWKYLLADWYSATKSPHSSWIWFLDFEIIWVVERGRPMHSLQEVTRQSLRPGYKLNIHRTDWETIVNACVGVKSLLGLWSYTCIIHKKGDKETLRHKACSVAMTCVIGLQNWWPPISDHEQMLQRIEAGIIQCCTVSKFETFSKFLFEVSSIEDGVASVATCTAYLAAIISLSVRWEWRLSCTTNSCFNCEAHLDFSSMVSWQEIQCYDKQQPRVTPGIGLSAVNHGSCLLHSSVRFSKLTCKEANAKSSWCVLMNVRSVRHAHNLGPHVAIFNLLPNSRWKADNSWVIAASCQNENCSWTGKYKDFLLVLDGDAIKRWWNLSLRFLCPLQCAHRLKNGLCIQSYRVRRHDQDSAGNCEMDSDPAFLYCTSLLPMSESTDALIQEDIPMMTRLHGRTFLDSSSWHSKSLTCFCSVKILSIIALLLPSNSIILSSSLFRLLHASARSAL